MPDVLPADPKDARLDQLAEWIGLIEVQFRDRMGETCFLLCRLDA